MLGCAVSGYIGPKHAARFVGIGGLRQFRHHRLGVGIGHFTVVHKGPLAWSARRGPPSQKKPPAEVPSLSVGSPGYSAGERIDGNCECRVPVGPAPPPTEPTGRSARQRHGLRRGNWRKTRRPGRQTRVVEDFLAQAAHPIRPGPEPTAPGAAGVLLSPPPPTCREPNTAASKGQQRQTERTHRSEPDATHK